MRINCIQEVRLFFQFLWRDIYVHGKNVGSYLFNYGCAFPVIYAVSVAYLQANTYFGDGNRHLGAVIFAGNALLVAMILTYKLVVELLFDFENNRFIDYQIILLNPRLVILERIIFTSLFSFIMLTPFYPVGKLVLQSNFDTSHTSWLKLMCVLYAGSLCCAAYQQCAVLFMGQTSRLSSLWARINNLLLMFGGFLVPLHIMQKYSPALGLIVRLNPMLYFSEGLRQAIVGGSEFLSFANCITVLFGYSVIFIFYSWYLFQKTTDHI